MFPLAFCRRPVLTRGRPRTTAGPPRRLDWDFEQNGGALGRRLDPWAPCVPAVGSSISADSLSMVADIRGSPGQQIERRHQRLGLFVPHRVGIFISMLPDDATVHDVVFGRDDHGIVGLASGLKPGVIHLCMSTISTAMAPQVAAEHARHGQGYVAASVRWQGARALRPGRSRGDVLLLDDEDGNPAEIIGADIEKDDT
jgi:hypothetical protein